MSETIHTWVEIRNESGWHLSTQEVFPRPPNYVEHSSDKRILVEHPFFEWQDYGLFGWLANVRNYAMLPPLSLPRGLPADISIEALDQIAPDTRSAGFGDPEPLFDPARRLAACDCQFHALSWVDAAELLDFDYDRRFVNQREEPPKTVTFRALFGEDYFVQLRILQSLGDPDNIRVIFGFR